MPVFHRYRKRVCWYAAIGGSRSNVFVLFAGRRHFFVFDSERRFKSRNACGKRRRVWFHKKANLLQEDFDVLYDKVSANLNFIEREKAVEKFWEDNQIFEKSIDSRRNGRTYTFYDGPPTANGKPHIGHVETRAFKDMIPRYHAMKGCMVPRKAGWDTPNFTGSTFRCGKGC